MSVLSHPSFLSHHSLPFIIHAWKYQIIGTLNDGRHFIVVVTLAWPNLHSCMPILTTSLPLSLSLSVFSLYFSIRPNFWIENTIMTTLQPHVRRCGHRLCAAHGNLFPMIHIYQMTLVCSYALHFLISEHNLALGESPTHPYCKWFRFVGATLKKVFKNSSPKRHLSLMSFQTSMTFFFLWNTENIFWRMFLTIQGKSMRFDATLDQNDFHCVDWLTE